MKYEFILSDHFRHFHFLVGVLLSQLCLSLNENKEQRKLAINAFRNVLCKHSYDNRYNTDKIKMARISCLYLPLIDILIENMARLAASPSNQSTTLKSNSETSTTQSTIANPNGSISVASLMPATNPSISSISISNGYAINTESN